MNEFDRRFDGDRVVGVGGLTLTLTVHLLRLPNAEMHTSCALDGGWHSCSTGTHCDGRDTLPQCGDHIAVELDQGNATAAGPVTLFCPTAPCGNVRADFCAASNLFCSPACLTHRRADNPAAVGEDLDLGASVELGRAMWGHYNLEPSARG